MRGFQVLLIFLEYDIKIYIYNNAYLRKCDSLCLHALHYNVNTHTIQGRSQ